MAKSSRSSRVKKNNQNLKKKLFGPAEIARSERMNAKLLELAKQQKSQQEMEVEGSDDKDGAANKSEDHDAEDDAEMDVDGSAAKAKSSGSWRLERNEKQKKQKAARQRQTGGSVDHTSSEHWGRAAESAAEHQTQYITSMAGDVTSQSSEIKMPW
ncbi:hypothetical protein D0868_11269 [Hortaea werneckii]|uniref:DUF2423 domain-containing protein n=1 Tax=Hortaea werneckii TaxID=91943 RepID=A0A3M7AR55_HORWE|nr:hypothetical protein D0868_11269 [Hortaea werneckii]RMY29887.1 hypothetical protein D0866_08380 [Hortaea werneckii]